MCLSMCAFESETTIMQVYLLTHGFVFIYAISCYFAEKKSSWRAITVQRKYGGDREGSPGGRPSVGD